MKRNHILAAALVLGAGGLMIGTRLAAGDRVLPDVVVITLDTTRADHLSCYGYFRETSPHLDGLAREAILFENAIAHMSTTLPSHLSLFTSTHTIRHGVHGNFSSFHRSWDGGQGIRTAAEIFAELGYETAAFVSAAPLKEVTGVAVGFDHYREPVENQCRAEETTTAVLDWLTGASRKPLFLWIHYFDPHDIYSAPPPFTTFFRTDDELIEQLRVNHYSRWDQLDIQHMANMYDSEIRYMDDQIGRLFDGLRAHGIWDDAALVVVGDHGEGLGQHDFVRHDPLNREQLHVPLIVKLPGSGGGGRSSRLTALIDVLPTLVEVLQLPVPDEVQDQFEGRHLIDAPSWDYVFSERARGRVKKLGPGEQYSLTGEDWKYFHHTEKPDELYDVRQDPFELQNVIDEYPDVANQLRSRIVQAVGDAARSDSLSDEALPEEHREQLRALGYVD